MKLYFPSFILLLLSGHIIDICQIIISDIPNKAKTKQRTNIHQISNIACQSKKPRCTTTKALKAAHQKKKTKKIKGKTVLAQQIAKTKNRKTTHFVSFFLCFTK